MLQLSDFFHLPELATHVVQLVADEPGLVLVAGLEPRSQGDVDGTLSGGRAMFFRILVRHLLESEGHAVAVVTRPEMLQLPPALRSRVDVSPVRPSLTYPGAVAAAAAKKPELLLLDHLDAEATPAALEAAQKGVRVLAQIDTALRGGALAHFLATQHGDKVTGRQTPIPSGLRWVVTVQRMATLCPHCKQEVVPEAAQQSAVKQRYPHLSALLIGPFYRAPGCAKCQGSGRQGDALAFDIYQVQQQEASTVLSLERYVLGLALAGLLSLDDLLQLEAEQMQRTYRLLAASERANVTLQGKLAEVEAAYHLLQQRAEALISLQGMSQALTSFTDLDELAHLICRHACSLSGADRAILYGFQPDDGAAVLGAHGWDPAHLPAQVPRAALVPATGKNGNLTEPVPFNAQPPHLGGRTIVLRAGLRVPLVVQGEVVAVMLLHSVLRPDFAPGEMALLQMFAAQAAVALQQAGLIARLQEKVAVLEATEVQ